MPVAHPNFYENLREAQMRLRSTTVCYEGVPYYVIAICGHKPDGIFRMYLVPLDRPQGAAFPATDNYAPDNPLLGGYLDDWLTANPNSGILRKNMDSKHFNKFRPFPLGMCNIGVKTFYLERQPQRNREQGLTRSMLYETAVSTSNRGANARAPAVTTDIFTAAFKACVLADHPSAQECLEALKTRRWRTRRPPFIGRSHWCVDLSR
jgi:hypothetical protein